MSTPYRETTSYWTNRVVSILLSISIAVTSFFLKTAWDRINEVEISVHRIELDTATNHGNRFTSTNWVESKAILDAERLALDRRVMRLEESLPVIKDSLIAIEKKVTEMSHNQ